MLLAAEVSREDTVLEIGPGRGALTDILLEDAGKVVAIEKDPELIEFLEDKFAPQIQKKKLQLVQKDVLDFSPGSYFPNPKSYKLIANIPYYITGEIIRSFLTAQAHPSSITLLVQDEVAKRILARDGKESVLSTSVKAYGTPKYVQKVSKKLFSPPPKVDSAILHIGEINKDFFYEISEEDFFFIVKQGFSQKRKKVVGNLSKGRLKEDILQIFENCKISSDARAENLSLKDWKCISSQFPQDPKTPVD